MAFFYVSRTHCSNTCWPILMKLLGYIELTLNWCNVIFSTSVSTLKPEMSYFSINRKFKISEPEVKNIPDRKKIKFQVVSQVSVWWYFEQGWRQRLLKNFAPYVLVYGHARTTMTLVATRIEKSKNEDRTLITKTHELSDEILFDFRLRCFQLPVSEKQLTSGLRSKPEVWKLTMQKLRVNCIHPQSFIRIHLAVSEEKRDQP